MPDKMTLSWEKFGSHATKVFQKVRDDEDLHDCTIMCEDQTFRVHRLVLSSCSPIFRRIIRSCKVPNPVIYLSDFKGKEVESLLDFIYCGESHVTESDLNDFIAAGQKLQVSGLDNNQSLEDEVANMDREDDIDEDIAGYLSQIGQTGQKPGKRIKQEAARTDDDLVDVKRNIIGEAQAKKARPSMNTLSNLSGITVMRSPVVSHALPERSQSQDTMPFLRPSSAGGPGPSPSPNTSSPSVMRSDQSIPVSTPVSLSPRLDARPGPRPSAMRGAYSNQVVPPAAAHNPRLAMPTGMRMPASHVPGHPPSSTVAGSIPAGQSDYLMGQRGPPAAGVAPGLVGMAGGQMMPQQGLVSVNSGLMTLGGQFMNNMAQSITASQSELNLHPAGQHQAVAAGRGTPRGQNPGAVVPPGGRGGSAIAARGGAMQMPTRIGRPANFHQ